MLMAIDVGNTQTVIGLYERDDGLDKKGPDHHWRVSTVERRTADEVALQIRHLLEVDGLSTDQVTGVAVASVVPRIRSTLRDWANRRLGVDTMILGPGVKTGMSILYDNPREVGADRIADAVAAYEHFGGPTIVIDFGTATTYEAVSAKGEYLGGVIVPGVEISLEALFAKTALLPRVELIEPSTVLAKNTVASVESGVLFGTAAQVDGLCRKLKSEVGEATVVATGGLAGLIAPLSAEIQHHEPWLTLDGLHLIFQRNYR